MTVRQIEQIQNKFRLPDTLALRSANMMMQPERLAALQPSRLSATRAFMRQLIDERWSFKKVRFDIKADGAGEALYHVEAPRNWVFSVPVLSFRPTQKGRTLRIIGTAWDMMGALVEGPISEADFETIRREAPKLYHGRATPGTLTWFRANRSSSFFNDSVAALAAGNQPDAEKLWCTGYAMRNSGVNGNGAFGTRTFSTLEPDHPLRCSLAAEMLSAYMMRVFSIDLMNHLASEAGSETAVELNPAMSRYLGVGNASAMGLMHFANNWPKLISRWMLVREKCIERAKILDLNVDPAPLDRLIALTERAITYRKEDKTPYIRYPSGAKLAAELCCIHKDLYCLRSQLKGGVLKDSAPFSSLCDSIEERFHPHTTETLLSLMIELVPGYADHQLRTLTVNEEAIGLPEMGTGELQELLRAEYEWVFEMDLDAPKARHFIWYKSRNAEEPRRGPRTDIDEKHELVLDVPRLIVELDAALVAAPSGQSVSRFLIENPNLRKIVTRVQSLSGMPYHSPHADIMHHDFVPAHITKMLNSGLHGLDKTVESGHHMCGVLFQGAPLPDEIAKGTADLDWAYPARPDGAK
jgi:hypothetical protein